MGLEEDLSVSPAVSTAIGSLAGVVEVLVQQPLVAWKNAVQDMRPVPLDPRLLYRGVFVNAASIAPINGVQFGINTLLEETFSVNGELSDGARTGLATAAGAVSGLVTGPPELVMIQQQKLGGSMTERLQTLVREHGSMALGRGMVPAVVREAVFTGAYLGVIPVMRERLVDSWPSTFAERLVVANVAASVAAGVGAAVFTQPFDTMKTRMQANLGDPTFRTMASTTRAMWQEGGTRLLFRGLLPRAKRVTFAVFILGEVKDRMTEVYLKMQPPAGVTAAAAATAAAGTAAAAAAAAAAASPHRDPTVALAMEKHQRH